MGVVLHTGHKDQAEIQWRFLSFGCKSQTLHYNFPFLRSRIYRLDGGNMFDSILVVIVVFCTTMITV